MKRLCLCVVLLVCFAVSVARAQDAQLSGRVTDQSGGVVARARVHVLSDSMGTSQSTDTNDQGMYVVSSVVPGVYQVSVQMPGFKTLTRTGVILEVAQKARLDFSLEAAPTQESVTVKGEASRINTADGTVGTVVDREFVENLPMNGRSFQSLILLTPGVTTNTPQSGALVGYSGELSVNGQRTESNRFMVDGVSANNGTYVTGYSTPGSGGGLPSGTAMGTTQSLVSLDALQEFRVSSSSYSAEYGSSPGAQFSFVTRSGTNTLHGSLFDYVRNDALDANDWFNNRAQKSKPQERQNDFGGTFGGPLTIPGVYSGRDRTFFFASYEGLRLRQPVPATIGYVPSVSLRGQASGVIQQFLNAFPLPNGADLGNGLSTYTFVDSVPSDLDSTSVLVDHVLSPMHRLMFRYSDAPSQTLSRFATAYQTKKFSPQSYTFGATSVLSNRMSNDLRVGYGRNEGANFYTYFNRDGAQPVDLLRMQGIDPAANPNAYLYLYLAFPGYSPWVGGSSSKAPQTQWNLNDTLTMVAGSHQFKAGVSYLRTASELQRVDPSIDVDFYSSSDLLANLADAYVVRHLRKYPVFNSLGAFVHDDWRVSPRLSLALGVRWEYAPPPSVSQGTLPVVLTGTVTNPASLSLAPVGTPLWKTTYGNLAPRVGAAYVLRDAVDYQTVLRSGAGIFFDNNHNIRVSAFTDNPGSAYVKSYPVSLSFPLTPAQLNIPNTSQTPPYSTINQIGDPAYPLQMPYTVQWNVSVEQELHAAQSLTVSYVGARGRRLLETDSLSLRPLNPSFTTVLLTRNGLTSSYDSLQAQFQRRLSHGIQAMASYTLAHAVDYGSSNANIPAKQGDADFDVRHSFSAAVTYELPSVVRNQFAAAVLDHWSVDGRFTARSAYPVTLTGNRLTDPATGQQYFGGLDLVSGVPLYINDASLPGGRMINPAAFALPVGSQVGNAPRNLVRGFGETQLDAVIRRDFPLSSTVRLQFRLESFNILNHPNFGVINSTFGNAQFGRATGMLNTSLGGLSALYQQGGPRSTQVSLRLAF